MELWKDIKWTDGQYQVSDQGRVRNKERGTILRHHIDAKGYARIKITSNRVSRTIKVHREVALAFVPNPDKKPQVNHINGNKLDNKADNLEWVTNQENVDHAVHTGLWERVFETSRKENDSRKTPIIATDISTGIETRYESMGDAERACKTRHINEVLDGKRMQANGYTFRREVI